MSVLKQIEIQLQEMVTQYGLAAVLAASADVFTCRCKCGNNWSPRNGKMPTQCPKCKRTNWQKEGETA